MIGVLALHGIKKKMEAASINVSKPRLRRSGVKTARAIVINAIKVITVPKFATSVFSKLGAAAKASRMLEFYKLKEPIGAGRIPAARFPAKITDSYGKRTAKGAKGGSATLAINDGM